MMPTISIVNPTKSDLDSMERSIVVNDGPAGAIFEEKDPTPKDAKTAALPAAEAANDVCWVAEGPKAQTKKDSGRLG
jgi:hypothetical protein